MAMPSRMPSIGAMTALVLAAAQADARREVLDAYDTAQAEFRREIDRNERQMIRELVKGWTWAAMPRIGSDDDRQTRSDDDPPRRLVRVTALAADAAGGAIVGGGVRGPMQLGATSVGMTQAQRGFIARVDRGGAFRMVQLAERETYRVPSALAIDRAGRILVSYEDHQLAAMTASGRTLWSRELPPARALAFAPDGDILAAGCNIVEHRERGINAFPVIDITEPYIARISPAGDVRWIYRLDQGQQELFYRPNDRRVEDCATGIARAPDGDVFVAGHFGRRVPPGRADEPNLPGAGSFVARFSADGRLRWSRLVAAGYGRVALASTPDGALAVVAGQVAARGNPAGGIDKGVAAFDADGVPRWSLPVRSTSASDDGPGTSIPIGPIANIQNIQIVAGRHRKADFVLVGTYKAGIAMGGATLSEQEGGVFLAEIDRRGSVTGLRGVPGKSRPAGAGDAVDTVCLGPGAAGLWVGGTTSVFTKGAWLHAVPW